MNAHTHTAKGICRLHAHDLMRPSCVHIDAHRAHASTHAADASAVFVFVIVVVVVVCSMIINATITPTQMSLLVYVLCAVYRTRRQRLTHAFHRTAQPVP